MAYKISDFFKLFLTKELWYIVGIFSIAIGGFFLFDGIKETVSGWFGTTKAQLQAQVDKQAEELKQLKAANDTLKEDLKTAKALHDIDLAALKELREKKETVTAAVQVIRKDRIVRVKEIDNNPDLTIQDKAIKTAYIELETITNVYCTTNPGSCSNGIPVEYLQQETKPIPAQPGIVPARTVGNGTIQLQEFTHAQLDDPVHDRDITGFHFVAPSWMRDDQDGIRQQDPVAGGEHAGRTPDDSQDASAPVEGTIRTQYPDDPGGNDLVTAHAEGSFERI